MGFLDAYIKKAVDSAIGEMIAEEIAGQIPAEQTPAGQTPAEQTPAEQTPAEQTPAEQTPAGQTSAGQNDTDYSKIAEMIKKEVGSIASSLKEGAKIPEKLTPEDAMASLVGLKEDNK